MFTKVIVRGEGRIAVRRGDWFIVTFRLLKDHLEHAIAVRMGLNSRIRQWKFVVPRFARVYDTRRIYSGSLNRKNGLQRKDARFLQLLVRNLRFQVVGSNTGGIGIVGREVYGWKRLTRSTKIHYRKHQRQPRGHRGQQAGFHRSHCLAPLLSQTTVTLN